MSSPPPDVDFDYDLELATLISSLEADPEREPVSSEIEGAYVTVFVCNTFAQRP